MSDGLNRTFGDRANVGGRIQENLDRQREALERIRIAGEKANAPVQVPAPPRDPYTG